MFAKADEFTAALTAAYRDAGADLLRRREQERSALVEALTTGALGQHGSAWEIASRLELPNTGAFATVAAEVPAVGSVALPEIAAKLRAVDISSPGGCCPTSRVGILSLPRADTADAELVVGSAATARVGISPVYAALEETPRALYLARLALQSAPPGTRMVRRFDDTPLATLVAAAPEAATRDRPAGARTATRSCAATSRTRCWKRWRRGWPLMARPPQPGSGCSSTRTRSGTGCAASPSAPAATWTSQPRWPSSAPPCTRCGCCPASADAQPSSAGRSAMSPVCGAIRSCTPHDGSSSGKNPRRLGRAGSRCWPGQRGRRQ